MAGRHPHGMRPRDTSAEPVVEDAIRKGYLDTQAVYVVDGFATHSAANKGRLAVKVAGEHLGVSCPVWVVNDMGEPCWKGTTNTYGHRYVPCKGEDTPHGLRFRVHNKNSARTWVADQSGGDPAKLKYNPFTKARGPIIDPDGHRFEG